MRNADPWPDSPDTQSERSESAQRQALDRVRVPITQNDHLRNRESSDNVEEILSILRLRKDGKSLREIAKTLEMSLGMVQRRLRTAEEQNIRLQEDSDSKTTIQRRRLADTNISAPDTQLPSPDGLYSDNLVMREVMKYISPQHWDKMDLLIRTFNLEVVNVTKNLSVSTT